MLDYFLILTTTGHTLLDRAFTPATPTRAQQVNALIAHLLISGTGVGTDPFAHGHHLLLARVNHQGGWLLVACTPKAIGAPYAPTLLDKMDRVVAKLFQDLPEADARLARTAGHLPGPAKDALATVFAQVLDQCERQPASPAPERKFTGGAGNTAIATVGGASAGNSSVEGSPRTGSRKYQPKASRQKKQALSGSTGGKQGRKWDDSTLSADDVAALDFLSSSGPNASSTIPHESTDVSQLIDAASMGQVRNGQYTPLDLTSAASSSSLASKLTISTADDPTAAAAPSFLSSMRSLFTGTRTLTATDLEPVIAKMESHLITKNVAAHVARDLVAGVSASLVGQKIGWSRVGPIVRQAMEDRLHRVLLPSASTDLLRDIRDAPRKPYVAVFCGVNGVGKSTNLAKITFWLLRNGLKVMIAACDTFRSGAVEQLRTHVRNLRILVDDLAGEQGTATIELFERGYGKDAAGIAKGAIASAKQRGFDIVLVDTAGRMQDNEPLMRSLAKLMAINQPDKVIFVGEALVGNESVDQLTKFNAAIRDFSSQANPRDIDAMILTKFDVIADKVGAAISMTYITKKPILFVGTGQTYTDLKRINVGAVVDALLSE